MTQRDAIRAGLMPAPKGSHEAIVAGYSDELLAAIVKDCGKRNLRDQKDHEKRWLAERLSAARWERKRRKEAAAC